MSKKFDVLYETPWGHVIPLAKITCIDSIIDVPRGYCPPECLEGTEGEEEELPELTAPEAGAPEAGEEGEALGPLWVFTIHMGDVVHQPAGEDTWTQEASGIDLAFDTEEEAEEERKRLVKLLEKYYEKLLD